MASEQYMRSESRERDDDRAEREKKEIESWNYKHLNKSEFERMAHHHMCMSASALIPPKPAFVSGYWQHVIANSLIRPVAAWPFRYYRDALDKRAKRKIQTIPTLALHSLKSNYLYIIDSDRPGEQSISGEKCACLCGCACIALPILISKNLFVLICRVWLLIVHVLLFCRRSSSFLLRFNLVDCTRNNLKSQCLNHFICDLFACVVRLHRLRLLLYVFLRFFIFIFFLLLLFVSLYLFSRQFTMF